MFLRYGFFLFASTLAAATAQAAIYTVGADADCTHASITAAADAAEAHPGADAIHVAFANTDPTFYTQQAITIVASQDLDIVGGFADCSQAASSGSRLIIDGDGGAAAPVVRITASDGARVRLSYLTIQHGDVEDDGKGGGIYFMGNGALELNHVSVTQNIAGYGGGIYAEGHGADTTELVIGADVSIVGNTARFDGGGIVNENAKMTMIAADSYIASNHASGDGGGLAIKGIGFSANTYISSSGLGNLGPIYLNEASRGGGVALSGFIGGPTTILHLFTTDLSRPVRIKGNSASVEGGGIYIGPLSMTQQAVALFAWDAWIEDNIAPKGAAIEDRSLAGLVAFNDPNYRPTGSIECPVNAPCGGVIGNVAENQASQPSGAIVDTDDFTFLYFNRMQFAGNTGKSLLYGDDRIVVRTQNVAITGNTVSESLVETDGDDNAFYLHNTTIAGNSIGDDTVLRISNYDDDVGKMYRTIIWQPGKTTLNLRGHPLELLDDMVSERGSVDGGNTPWVVEQDPRFVDPEHGDYSLRAGSPAIDRTTSVAGDGMDLFSNRRDVDLPIANFPGVRDVGAIERQTLQPLVLNSDFDIDMRLWSATAFGVTTWDATRNASGPAGSGSVHITQPDAATGTHTGGLVQCVHLPGPGIYALNGWGHGTGTAVAGGDIAQLYWEYRKSGGESCTGGAPNATGTKTLSNSNNWARPTTPALIEVTEQDWTFTSSIAVTLVAVENGPSGAPTNAWFDGITLDVDTILANGFDN